MWKRLATPDGMTRRHFMSHMAGSSAMFTASLTLGHRLAAAADQMKSRRKSAILLWMGGGPSTIDLWDLKPGSATGGPFKPISTAGDMQICEHLPKLAKHMDKLSIVRSMSTREADHNRGRYYMHTGYVPNPNIQHPGYGSVVAHELASSREGLDIPPFVSVGGASEGPGFLGMAWAPFNVSRDGRIRDMNMQIDDTRLQQRIATLGLIENNFISTKRGNAAQEHQKVLGKTLELLTSEQMAAFRVADEPQAVRDAYGRGFGEGCLLARRLVEAGVPFVEVDMGGWDMHQGIFDRLQNTHLPELDNGFAALMQDLSDRSMLDDTVVIWMGEFGRTPRINADAGRDHWARAWSVVVGGGKLKRGVAIGETNEDGTQVMGETYSSEDLMSTICWALDIPLDITYTSKNGRPMKIAGGGKLIEPLKT